VFTETWYQYVNGVKKQKKRKGKAVANREQFFFSLK